MKKIFKLRPKAITDLEKTYKYSVKKWGNNRADKYIRDIETTFETLADNYMLGMDYSHVGKTLRAFAVVSHIIYYKKTTYGVIIIRVLHKRMDENRHL